MLVKLAKGYKFSGNAAPGITYHGPVILNGEFLYLVHNSHTWDTANTYAAMFGLLGAAIHHFTTRNRSVPYPFEAVPYRDLKQRLEEAPRLGKVKDTAMVMRIPRGAIRGYKAGMFKYTEVLCDGGPITLYGAVSEIKAVLEEQGIPDASM
ncbi:MAG: hypothetical protein ACYC6Y_26795 [Thermoguttaceae bacterium]